MFLCCMLLSESEVSAYDGHWVHMLLQFGTFLNLGLGFSFWTEHMEQAQIWRFGVTQPKSKMADVRHVLAARDSQPGRSQEAQVYYCTV